MTRIRFAVALVLVIAGGGAAGGQSWPDPVAHEVLPYTTAGLTHGPCLGQPGSTGMKVWLRTAKPSPFEIVFDTKTPLTASSPKVAGKTDPQADNTGVATLTGLQPNTRYFYGVRINGHLADLRVDASDPWPSFRTLPDESTCPDPKNNPRGLFNFAFSIGCCASQDPIRSGGQYASPPAFDTLLRQYGDDIAFHFMNGDTIYEERRDGTTEGIRANYRLYWQRGRSFSRLMRNVSMLFMYDDHEIGWDIHGCGEVGLGDGKWLIRDPGAAAWSEYCGWASYDADRRGRILFGKAEMKAGSPLLHDERADFSKLNLKRVSTLHVGPYTLGGVKKTRPAPPNAGVYRIAEIADRHTLRLDRPAEKTGQAPYSIGTHHYYDWKVGNCHFFALDTRGERTRPNFDDYRDATRSILGSAQKRWLVEGVKKTDARFVFIISPDPFVIYHTAFHVNPSRGGAPKGDGFASFVHEREELIELFDRLEKPVLVLTGDVHASAAVKITDNVWEFLCGPMGSSNHPIGTCGGATMPFAGRWKSQGRAVHVKWIGTFPNNVHYSRLRQPYFAVVQVNNVSRSPRPKGTGYQWVAFDAPQVVVRFHDGYTGKLVYAEGISAETSGLRQAGSR